MVTQVTAKTAAQALQAGYDWRIFVGIAAFWIGGLVLNYFLARIVTRRTHR